MTKVLVIGDDAVSRLVLEHMLVTMGLDVVTGDSVDEAVRALSQSLFDLIVCDYLMPERTGLELLAEAAECPTPFVLVAGEADWHELGEAPINGVAAHLTKPVSNRELVDVVNNVVGSPVS